MHTPHQPELQLQKSAQLMLALLLPPLASPSFGHNRNQNNIGKSEQNLHRRSHNQILMAMILELDNQRNGRLH